VRIGLPAWPLQPCEGLPCIPAVALQVAPPLGCQQAACSHTAPLQHRSAGGCGGGAGWQGQGQVGSVLSWLRNQARGGEPRLVPAKGPPALHGLCSRLFPFHCDNPTVLGPRAGPVGGGQCRGSSPTWQCPPEVALLAAGRPLPFLVGLGMRAASHRCRCTCSEWQGQIPWQPACLCPGCRPERHSEPGRCLKKRTSACRRI
jgi:hypothetical protein